MTGPGPQAAPVLAVDLGPGVRAAFTTADDGFDLSLETGRDRAEVLRNRSALEAWAGAPLALARQVHGRDVHVVTAPPAGPGTTVGDADALVTRRTDATLTVLVADCVPVLLADARSGVVATVHAGRRGLVAGVVDAALDALVAQGAVELTAVVGPSACGRCYEVPAQMRDEVAAQVPHVASTTSWGTPALDLAGAVVARLDQAGVRVHRAGGCTIEHARWFSHRASSGGSGAAAAARPPGRMSGVVRLLPST